jgi:hypothetical protein
MLRAAVLLVAGSVLLSGCTILLSPRKLRVGRFDDYVVVRTNMPPLAVEKTTGIVLQWWPDPAPKGVVFEEW